MLGAISKNYMAKISKKLNRFNIVLINNQITIQSFDLIHKYRLSHGLSTAIIADLELFTYNTKDFKFISGLKLFTP